MALVEIIDTLVDLVQLHELLSHELQTVCKFQLIVSWLQSANAQTPQHTVQRFRNLVEHSLAQSHVEVTIAYQHLRGSVLHSLRFKPSYLIFEVEAVLKALYGLVMLPYFSVPECHHVVPDELFVGA